MKKQLVVLATLAAAAACADSPAGIRPGDVAALSSGVSDGGVVPTFGSTNIPGDGAAVCEALAPGAGYLGFKVDPTNPNDTDTQDGITWWIDATDQNLGWSASGSIVKLVLVKGGDGHHVYAYNPPAFSSDDGLHSPTVGQGNVPEISHFSFCYVPDVDTAEGCTPGFWKNRGLSIGEWALAGYDPAANVTTVFSNVRPAQAGATLHQALSFPGGTGLDGGQRILLRAAVAALLNAAHSDVDYPLTAAQVISQTSTALGGTRNAMLALATTLDGHNNAGCPLGAPRD